MPVKIFSALQLKRLDAYTIQHEPIRSVDLIERAADTFLEWFEQQYKDSAIDVICGLGNNGADGLAIARKWFIKGRKTRVHIIQISKSSSPEFDQKLAELKEVGFADIQFISPTDELVIHAEDIIVDCILGIGIHSPVDIKWEFLFNSINYSPNKIISIDIPSGLHPDQFLGGISIRADYCFSFELPKLCFLFPETGRQIKKWSSHSIGLSKEFIDQERSPNYFTTADDLKGILKERNPFSYKNQMGHVALFAGSKKYYGSALLSCSAAMKSGVGLTTAFLPDGDNTAMHVMSPETICIDRRTEAFEADKYTALAIGPGLIDFDIEPILMATERSRTPLVLDAEALNQISLQPALLDLCVGRAILTPHVGEFDRMFGRQPNCFERMATARRISAEKDLIIVLKGRYTAVVWPTGDIYFNPTGNPGMAKAGCGDVLTGIIVGLLGQAYSLPEAALLGVYLHGLAGDLAEAALGIESIVASDIIKYLGSAFQKLKS